MIKFRFLSFQDDLLQQVIEDNRDYSCLYLFPTLSSARTAQRLYQPCWRLERQSFTTMEEWKKSLISPGKPLLREEKRHLIFYQSLSESHRKHFQLTDYFQSQELARNFFHFWEDLQSESIPPDRVRDLLSPNDPGSGWQLSTFDRLEEIRENYRIELESRGYADIIFSQTADIIPKTDDYQRFVVVNQFYFTALEKALLRKIPQDVLLYFQLPAECLDKDNLEVKADFSALHIRENRTQRIRMFQAENQFSMLMHLLQDLETSRPEFIVDFNPESQFYASLLSPAHFELSNRISLGNLPLFSLVKTCYILLSRLSKEERTGKLLLPWEIYLQAVNSPEFRCLFDREACPDEIWEELQNFLQKIRREDYLYIDLDNSFLQFWQVEPPLKELLGKINTLLAELMQLNHVIDLVSFWGSEELFYRIFPSVLTSRTNLIQVYYQALADFTSLESSGILGDPAALISQAGKQPAHIRISSALHRLFLDFLQAREIRYNIGDNTRFRFKNLHELRNLQLDNVTIINVTEGVIPPAPRSPFLLTEAQRKQLGLMTFEDFKLREKYYLFRLIATSREVDLYTYHHEAEDTEVSSFLEELVIHNLIPEKSIIQVPNHEYAPVYNCYWQQGNSLPLPDRQLLYDPSFYLMPFDPGKDDKEGILPVNGYSCREIREDPWRYYLNSICALQPYELTTSFDFSEKMAGTLAHEILRKIWEKLLHSTRNGTIQLEFLHNRDQEIAAACQQIWSDPQLLYKSPHNYSELYFREIFLPVLQVGIKSLFHQLPHQLGLTGVPLEIRTETGEVTFLPLISDIKGTYQLRLSGRFDLLLRSPAGVIIIDYKTGRVNSGHNLQLAFYELLYSLNHPEPGSETLASYIYYIEEQKLNDLSSKQADKTTLLMDFRNDLVMRFTELINRGIALPEKRGYGDLAEIERWEDYHHKILRKNDTGQKDN